MLRSQRMMDSKKGLNMATSLDELDDCQSTDSKESQDTKDGGAGRLEAKKETKWTDFRKKKNNKRAGAEKTEKINRFYGDGVNFKAKLIGIKEVDQPRGDRLAQNALHELKASVKASSSHKMKIMVNISLEGIKLKDEKAAEVLHHHPVHKISFIAQDITDPRAFGYVFGSPALGHKFFAIKTEKAAQQLVVAMRDLFHVVFEQRKKELQNQKNSAIKQNGDVQDSTSDKSSVEDAVDAVDAIKSDSSGSENGQNETSLKEPIDDLLDLINEHNSEGSNKTCAFDNDFVENPSADKTNDAFFSDPLNFINNFSSSLFTQNESPFNDKDIGTNSNSVSEDLFARQEGQSASNDSVPQNHDANGSSSSSEDVHRDAFGTAFIVDKYAPLANLTLDEASAPISEPSELPSLAPATDVEPASSARTHTVSESSASSVDKGPPKPPHTTVDLFSDLDPLGKDRPFVDKKDFFQEVKNPPKKVLKDLMDPSQSPSSNSSSASSDSSLSRCSSHDMSNSPPPVTFSTNPSASSADDKVNASFPFAPFSPFPSGSMSNAFDDPFFTEDFHLPSPSQPPPPLPPQTPPVVTLPPPPPRPPNTIPPPLPPKRIPPPAAPLIKLVPPPDAKLVGEDNARSSKSQSKSNPTLPIPIPLRKVHLEVASKSGGSVSMASASSSFSSANGTSCSSSNPSCPPNSLNDGSFLSSLDAFSSNPSSMSVSSGSHLFSTGRSPFVNGDVSPSSGSTASPFSDFTNSFTDGCIVRVAPKFSEGHDNNNNSSSSNRQENETSNSKSCQYVNNFFNNSVTWDPSTSNHFIQKHSIFKRETDPFADDFFQSPNPTMMTTNHCSSSSVQNNANQVRLGNPFAQNAVNTC